MVGFHKYDKLYTSIAATSLVYFICRQLRERTLHLVDVMSVSIVFSTAYDGRRCKRNTDCLRFHRKMLSLTSWRMEELFQKTRLPSGLPVVLRVDEDRISGSF